MFHRRRNAKNRREYELQSAADFLFDKRLQQRPCTDQMLDQRELQCPLFALPADVARVGASPKSAYTRLIRRTSSVFRAALDPGPDSEARANAIVSLCVGAMLLANTTDDPDLRRSLRQSARASALALLSP